MSARICCVSFRWLLDGWATHSPYYDNSYASLLPELEVMRLELETLLVQHQVDLVLFGHIHQYQRTCRMVAYKCDDIGPAYMVVGTAGATHQVPFFPQPKWVERQSMEFGVSKFTVLNASVMHVQWFLDANGTVGDDFFLTRGHL